MYIHVQKIKKDAILRIEQWKEKWINDNEIRNHLIQ